MAKSKVARQEKTHAVKVREGSNIAQSRPAPKSGPAEKPPARRPAVQSSATPGTPRRTPGLTPRPSPAKPGPATIPKPAQPPAKPAASASPAPKASELWAPNEAVLQRLTDLRKRNALLAKQLDRLSASKSSSGDDHE
jgi:hypothetical protein